MREIFDATLGLIGSLAVIIAIGTVIANLIAGGKVYDVDTRKASAKPAARMPKDKLKSESSTSTRTS